MVQVRKERGANALGNIKCSDPCFVWVWILGLFNQLVEEGKLMELVIIVLGVITFVYFLSNGVEQE